MTRDDGRPPSLTGHIPVLDGVRGVAILLVLVYHLWHAPVGFSTLRIDEYVSNVIGTGWMGVDLFFVLSGFLITGILLDAKSGGRYFRSFYARRFLRIFPLYYAFIFALVVVLPLFPAFRNDVNLDAVRRHQFWLWTYLLNVDAARHPLVNVGGAWTGHLWSLAVEEQFYLIWPAVVLVCSRRSLLGVCALCIVGAPILRVAILHDYVREMNTALASHVLMPSRADSLAVGALIAIAVRQEAWRPLLRRAGPPCAVAGALLFVAVAFYEHTNSILTDNMQIFGLSALAIGYGGVLMTVLMAPSPGRIHAVFSHSALRFFGRYAYGLYVLHLPIAHELSVRVVREGGFRSIGGSDIPARLVFLFVVGSMSVTAAWLSWNLYEKQFLKLKRFFPYGHAADPQPRADGEGKAALAAP